MSDRLLRQLRMLEGEYPNQPLVAQKEDLLQINQLRAQLGMSLVDASLKEAETSPVVERQPEPEPEPECGPDHREAREIYLAHLRKIEELKPHRAYAEAVVRATSGVGQTPVRPLATLGPGGGPLLCDHCRKPMVLEGGRFHGVPADVAWQQNPVEEWRSWILGGMVVEVMLNGTLRIYHGYPGHSGKQCCNIASKEDKKARENFVSARRPEHLPMILAFLEDQFPGMPREGRFNLLNQILDTVFWYDPGIGINRPGGEILPAGDSQATDPPADHAS